MSAIVMNGKSFAKGKAGLIESLFIQGGTASGYWKRSRDEVKFFAPDDRHIATVNRHGVLCRATKLECGKTWYNLGDPDIIGRNPSYLAGVDEAQRALDISKANS